jgi:hypothetical protein
LRARIGAHLLRYGADVNAVASSGEVRVCVMCVVSVTHVPQTPLHYAVNGSCFELIAPLLRAGAKYVHVYACAVRV